MGNSANRDPDHIAQKLYDNLQQSWEVEFPEHIPHLDEIADIDKELCHYQLNDKGNAQRFIKRYGKDLLFVPEAGWFGWTGKFWSLDEGPMHAQKCAHRTTDAMRKEALAKLAFRNLPTETPVEFRDRVKKFFGFAVQAGNSVRLNAMVREAAPYLKCYTHDLDTHEYLLNVENGVLDLASKPKAGDENMDPVKLKKHNRKHHLTKLVPVEYKPEAEAPHFMKFLNDVQPDPEIQLFLQRFFGYCLTGSIKEQVIVMFYGGGANGKSTLMNVMNKILGDYAMNLPFASLLHDDRKRGSEASPDLARLPGARFVTAAEPDVGSKFSESVLKQLTGGEKMAVRHLNRDFFEFTPQFKLCLAFNNKPQIRGQDDGIWRRVCLVPFNQQFVSKEKLKDNPKAKPRVDGLEDALWEEASGILNWILDGYRMWREGGLQIPDQVREATGAYRQESNPVGDFIRTMLKTQQQKSLRASELYKVYTLWCKANAQRAWSQSAFGRQLEPLGLKKERIGGYVYYSGVSLSDEGQELLDDASRAPYGEDGKEEGGE